MPDQGRSVRVRDALFGPAMADRSDFGRVRPGNSESPSEPEPTVTGARADAVIRAAAMAIRRCRSMTTTPGMAAITAGLGPRRTVEVAPDREVAARVISAADPDRHRIEAPACEGRFN